MYDKLERVDGFNTITSVLPSSRHLLPGVIKLVINYKDEIKFAIALEQVVLYGIFDFLVEKLFIIA